MSVGLRLLGSLVALGAGVVAVIVVVLLLSSTL
jgi:hypothetical protein